MPLEYGQHAISNPTQKKEISADKILKMQQWQKINGMKKKKREPRKQG